MEKKDRILAQGFIYKRFDSKTQGTYYYIVVGARQGKENTYYHEVIASKFSDSMISSQKVKIHFSLEFTELENEQANTRYPSANHIPAGKEVLLREDEIEEFVSYHPRLLEQLKRDFGLEKLVMVP